MLNVIVIPANKADEYNENCRKAGLAVGKDNFFSIPIYKGNSQNVTHYAAYCGLGKHYAKLEKIVGKNSFSKVKSSDAGGNGLAAALAKKDMKQKKPNAEKQATSN